MEIYSVVDDQSEQPVPYMGYMLQVCVASHMHVGTLDTLCVQPSNRFQVAPTQDWSFAVCGALSVLLAVWEQSLEHIHIRTRVGRYIGIAIIL